MYCEPNIYCLTNVMKFDAATGK